MRHATREFNLRLKIILRVAGIVCRVETGRKSTNKVSKKKANKLIKSNKRSNNLRRKELRKGKPNERLNERWMVRVVRLNKKAELSQR